MPQNEIKGAPEAASAPVANSTPAPSAAVASAPVQAEKSAAPVGVAAKPAPVAARPAPVATKPVAVPATQPVAPAAPKAASPAKPAGIKAAAKPVAPKLREAKRAVAKPAKAKPAAARSAAVAPAARSAPPAAVAKPAAPAAKPAAKSAKPAKPAAKLATPRQAAAKVAKTAPAPRALVEKAVLPAKPAPVKASVAKTAAVPAAAKQAPQFPNAMAFQARFASLTPGEGLPKAVQDMAASSLTQAREAYSSLRHSAETLTTGIETSGQAAARGIQSFSTSVLDAVQANADATVGFLKAMAGVRTLSEAIELQARHARLQFEAAQSQAKTLANIANKTVTETAQPVRKAIDAGLSRSA